MKDRVCENSGTDYLVPESVPEFGPYISESIEIESTKKDQTPRHYNGLFGLMSFL